MKARRTPWWYYLLAMLLGLAAGVGIAKYGERTGLPLIGAPWFVAALLALLGVVVLVLAWQVHKYATTDPAKRSSVFDPMKAVYTLVLAKALGLAGAALAGWYGGQILASLPHAQASYFSEAILECAITGAVSLADMVIGIIGERLCQLPPNDGPEHPKVTEPGRSRGLAQPTANRSAE
ncbi:DUF3180 domain-containing protein [Bifidobacterium tibiigranuli]|jgi:putative Mn2+ efflux pump MntP|uniref:DUF3180 domain-containing protein n=1 Tax=Bifidobacterium tibiigranuli TaxID=2172043 RepID=UPI0026EFFFF4|nr:DUF3180 domain-containing protein [Bifidobacterium tibiigranuli]MCI1650022.1 DUF3180 domain-containing protein [Bifidobacterium tibiigranuli]MCI2185098.1 DUF3180 domain-containing protein [Bifidobacterium tibiigranuli]MCI2203337.1 DUF3180 domain-containing protein [Bifidobacterium tibiigranuli]